jgi:hypothetical protein
MAAMKRSGKKMISGATGAPPAGFLSALEMEAPIHYCITVSRKRRESFALVATDKITERVYLDLMELADRVAHPKWTGKVLDNSAQSLAAMAILAAELLEHLASVKDWHDSQMISFAARKSECWPILMRLGVKRNKKGERCLEGADKAKAYLIRIKQGQNAATKLKYFSDRNANKFKRAAELLLHELVSWRERGAWRGTITVWAKELFALGDLPMTADNVGDWWLVAKCWMDEQWETNRKQFDPLIKSCKHTKEDKKTKVKQVKQLSADDVGLFESEIKSRVIDLRLKESFFALAKPADL